MHLELKNSISLDMIGERQSVGPLLCQDLNGFYPGRHCRYRIHWHFSTQSGQIKRNAKKADISSFFKFRGYQSFYSYRIEAFFWKNGLLMIRKRLWNFLTKKIVSEKSIFQTLNPDFAFRIFNLVCPYSWVKVVFALCVGVAALFYYHSCRIRTHSYIILRFLTYFIKVSSSTE